MRRVYYAYAIRLAHHPVTIQIGLFVAALFIFAHMVHVAKVVQNMLSTSLGNVPQFVFNALMHGEVLTLIALGVMTFVLLSLGWRTLTLPRMVMQTSRVYT